MTKKISKVIIYYEDGTYQEIENSVLGLPSKEDKKLASPSPVIPDFRPDTQQLRDWQQHWAPPFTVTCSTGDVPLSYTVSSDPRDTTTWSFTSTGNADNLNKYTITSTGNGNVDLSK